MAFKKNYMVEVVAQLPNHGRVTAYMPQRARTPEEAIHLIKTENPDLTPVKAVLITKKS